MADATWRKTIKNLRVHLDITKVKVVHHISHQNFFKKSNIGIVLPLKERMAPSLFSCNRVENINFEEKGHLSVRPMSFSIWVFLSLNPENLPKKWQIWIWIGWLIIKHFTTQKNCSFSFVLTCSVAPRSYSSIAASSESIRQPLLVDSSLAPGMFGFTCGRPSLSTVF